MWRYDNREPGLRAAKNPKMNWPKADCRQDARHAGFCNRAKLTGIAGLFGRSKLSIE
ncbi:hypothetical protein [Derxia lacustris]|uniref:hypothetical protein n=1 Tax=Derxia lacustris TaxID=764842 RepID=UPI0015938347|nr:hypothetical protein [Derxia lacustris]